MAPLHQGVRPHDEPQHAVDELALDELDHDLARTRVLRRHEDDTRDLRL